MTQLPAGANASTALDYGVIGQHRRIVLLTDGHSTPFLAKTAISIIRYREQDVVGVLESSAKGQTAANLFGIGHNVPVIASLDEVGEADSIYIGIAPPGGKMPAHWKPILLAAIERGMDVVSGLHDFIQEDEALVGAAKTRHTRLIDVRKNRLKSTARHASFAPQSLRVHTVGHDCSVGKMVVTLELQRAFSRAGEDARFLATGQTGIMISGAGVPIDCVVADFVNGAAEDLVLAHDGADYLFIEGQGSISHPAFSAVTLGLLHGCAPQGLIFCYQAGREHVKGLDNVAIPQLEKQIAAYEQLANLRHPCRVIGIGVNTRDLAVDEALREVENAERRFGLPACDVYRQGADKLVNAVRQLKQQVCPTCN